MRHTSEWRETSRLRWGLDQTGQPQLQQMWENYRTEEEDWRPVPVTPATIKPRAADA